MKLICNPTWMAIDLSPIKMMTMEHASLTRLSEQDYLDGESAHPVRGGLTDDAPDRIDVACAGTRLALTLDDLYEATGLRVV